MAAPADVDPDALVALLRLRRLKEQLSRCEMGCLRSTSKSVKSSPCAQTQFCLYATASRSQWTHEAVARLLGERPAKRRKLAAALLELGYEDAPAGASELRSHDDVRDGAWRCVLRIERHAVLRQGLGDALDVQSVPVAAPRGGLAGFGLLVVLGHLLDVCSSKGARFFRWSSWTARQRVGTSTNGRTERLAAVCSFLGREKKARSPQTL